MNAEDANAIGRKLMEMRFTNAGKDYIREVILRLPYLEQEDILSRWPALVEFTLSKKTWGDKPDKPIIVGDKSKPREPRTSKAHEILSDETKAQLENSKCRQSKIDVESDDYVDGGDILIEDTKPYKDPLGESIEDILGDFS